MRNENERAEKTLNAALNRSGASHVTRRCVIITETPVEITTVNQLLQVAAVITGQREVPEFFPACFN